MDDDVTIENLGLRSVKLKPEYNTDDDNIIRDLYRPCLANSINYDRAVGYFRANIYRELGEDLLNFVIKGGKVRIVCSPNIPKLDEQAAREGYLLRGVRTEEEQEEELLKILQIMSRNPKETDCLEMLRLLIETNSLELFLAIRPGGIYHRKIGLFSDSFGNKVVFSGSGNETLWALGSIEDWVNDEDFDVYTNWGNEFELYKSKIKENHLIQLFTGGSGRTKVRPLNKVERDFLNKFRLYNNFEECRYGARQRTAFFEKLENSQIVPYAYQKEAIDSWNNSSMIGILSMATGTGKTYTALFAIKELLNKGSPVLILVPSIILLSQWRESILKIYPDVPILMAGGGSDWKSDVNKRMFISNIGLPRIILCTMATGSSHDFLDFIKQAKNATLIADEVHRLGSPTYRRILSLGFKYKLGLSATPERLFDEEGSKILEKGFGKKPVYYLPISARVKLSDTDVNDVPILGHFLSRYDYYFYTVSLTNLEQESWNSLTNEIRRIYAWTRAENKEDKKSDINQKLKLLLIQRARIVKKAQNKIGIINRIIKEKYPSDGRWIIYCEDEAQLDAVFRTLSKDYVHLNLLKYHSKMTLDERDRTIDYFENIPSIIISIRCLDEGVDIPQADGAIILASSSNPRQYIQRRGRVLRKFKNKTKADIIDVIVLPQTYEEDIPHSIVRSELARAWNFSQNAMNRDVTHRLWKICIDYHVDLPVDTISGIEYEELGN